MKCSNFRTLSIRAVQMYPTLNHVSVIKHFLTIRIYHTFGQTRKIQWYETLFLIFSKLTLEKIRFLYDR